MSFGVVGYESKTGGQMLVNSHFQSIKDVVFMRLLLTVNKYLTIGVIIKKYCLLFNSISKK